jgi:CubicO group peptidase (beta-lactamase class C family)
MRLLPLLSFTVLVTAVTCSKKDDAPPTLTPAYDFTTVDKLLTDNLQSIYKGKVYAEIAKDGQPIYAQGLGGYTANSSGLIASCTKTFSAVVVLALVDDGLLKLDDPIGKFLPIFNQFNKGTPTLRQCFAHSSGFLSDETTTTYVNSKTLTLAQAVDGIAKDLPLTYAPSGSQFAYGNVSMHIAGRVAEVVSGKSWAQLFKEKVVDKCDLKGTYFTNESNPLVAGGLVSTPADVMKLANMLLNKGLYGTTRVLSEAAWAEYWKDQTNGNKIAYTPYPLNGKANNPYSAVTTRYGMGCWLDIQNPTTQYVEQISGDGAFGCIFWVNRCTGITGVVFTTSTFQAVYGTTWQVMDAVRKQVKSTCN